MEIVIVTKNRNVGIDEDVSDLSDFDYFSLLPNYHNSIGLISNKSLKMLSKYRRAEIKKNILDCLTITNKKLIFNQKDSYFIYKIENIRPVLYEVPGYNCIINFKGIEYHLLKSIKSFFLRDSNFTENDFNNLELNTEYMICSYFEGEASFIYTIDRLVPTILDDFNTLCIKKCESKITIEEL
jgi:hypothetical protein